MEKCEYCGIEIEWEESSCTNGLLWECEECGKSICSKCIEEVTKEPVGKSDEVLCIDCLDKKNRYCEYCGANLEDVGICSNTDIEYEYNSKDRTAVLVSKSSDGLKCGNCYNYIDIEIKII